MQFACEAMRPDGTTVLERVEAGDRHQAVENLRQKGLLILRLDEQSPGSPVFAAAARPGRRRVAARDLILLTRQMKMLLESGTPLVPALLAAEEQTTRPAMRALLKRVRARVEGGDSLAAALQPEENLFDPVFRSMVAAGEATASLPQTFTRLCALAQQQRQTRKLIIGALVYPAILSIMLVAVLAVLLLFVIPRFRILFTSLRSPLPPTTQLLFALSQYVLHGWPYLLALLVAVIAALTACFRMPQTRTWLSELLLRLPVVGNLAGRLLFARVLRIWAAMLRSHVPLLDTIRHSREAITSSTYLRLLTDVEETVASGGRMGQAIANANLADPVIVSALRTGEENGRLADAADFVSDWMDDENSAAVQQLTRMAEPLLLAVMGLIVGFVALSLFLPLFDLASAA
jgi:type II secretory pathway component PulF